MSSMHTPLPSFPQSACRQAHDAMGDAPSTPAASLAALADVLQQNRGRMLRLARRIVRDADAAADVVQDATLAALQALPEFRQGAAPGTWLHRIVVNAALMHLRRGRTRREVSAEALYAMKSPAPDPAAAAEEHEAVRRLRACLPRLSEQHRNVVELRDILGFDTDSTAVMLGVSSNAVKIRLHRARRALRGLFEGRQVDAAPATRSRTDVRVVSRQFTLRATPPRTRTAG